VTSVLNSSWSRRTQRSYLSGKKSPRADKKFGNSSSGRVDMTTKEAIEGYFSNLKQKKDWPSFLSDEMVFTSFTSPIRRISGKAAFLDSTKRFYAMITAMEVRDLLVDGDKACALTRYELQPPQGPAFGSDVAEVFGVRDGKITSFDIYFDSSPYPK
jgi:ketosteroid isomerase-like protein